MSNSVGAAVKGTVGTGTIETALGHASQLLGSHPAAALAQAREVLAVVPGHPQAQLIEGKALRLLGDLAGARAVLAALAAAQPRSAASALELGLAAGAQGDSALAIQSLGRATALKPDWPLAWSALAAALREAGRHAEADRADLGAVRASTRDPVLIEAALALGEGRLDVAEPLLRGRLKSQPTDVAATRMLGELAWRLGRVDDALALLRRTVQLAPGFEAARELLARILSRSNRTVEAIAEASALMAANPANASHAMLKASLLVRVGDQEGARQIYADLVERQPHQPKTWMSLGHVLKTIGRQPEAIAAYREALAISPGLGEVWWSLANLKTVRFDAADVALMQRGLETVTGKEDRLHLHFALGKALEDAGEDEAAFGHYAIANSLRREDLDYDAEETHADVRQAAGVFSRAFLAARAADGCPAPDPIFIVGLPRAGSTLIEQILSSHSQIEGTMELPDLMMIAARLEARDDGPGGDSGMAVAGESAGYAEALHSLAPADLRRLGEEYIERTRVNRRTDKPLFIDKMPNNWQHVGLIRLILPHAKIIDARRHPMGGCFSAWKQHFARGQGFSYDLVDVGRYYRDYVAHMAHFDAVAPGAIHRVIY